MHRKHSVVLLLSLALGIVLMLHAPTVTSQSSLTAQDPGVRGGAAGAGDPIAGLSSPCSRGLYVRTVFLC